MGPLERARDNDREVLVMRKSSMALGAGAKEMMGCRRERMMDVSERGFRGSLHRCGRETKTLHERPWPRSIGGITQWAAARCAYLAVKTAAAAVRGREGRGL